ncbi:hypothetical protein D3C81_1899280 [compost metagenome]
MRSVAGDTLTVSLIALLSWIVLIEKDGQQRVRYDHKHATERGSRFPDHLGNQWKRTTSCSKKIV